MRFGTMSSTTRSTAAWALGGLVTCATIAACTTGYASIRASRLLVVDRNDTLRGDEPYLGAIQWASIYGEPESTRVTVYDALTSLGSQVRPGESRSVPEEVGAAPFGLVSVLSRDDVEREGHSPGIGGVIYVALEEDHGGRSQVRERLHEVAAELEEILVEHVEQETWDRFAVPLTLQAIQEGLSDGEPGSCGILNSRACRWFRGRLGDDFIGQATLIYVGVDQPYFDVLVPTWRAAAGLSRATWPECGDAVSPVCPVVGGTHELQLGGGDGEYRLTTTLTFPR